MINNQYENYCFIQTGYQNTALIKIEGASFVEKKR